MGAHDSRHQMGLRRCRHGDDDRVECVCRVVLCRLWTYIRDDGGLVQAPVVHPSVPAGDGAVAEAVPSDGVQAPVHRREHLAAAEGSVGLPGDGQVELLLRRQVGAGDRQDPVRVAVALRVRVHEEDADEGDGQQEMGEAESQDEELLEEAKIPDGSQDLTEVRHLRCRQQASDNKG